MNLDTVNTPVTEQETVISIKRNSEVVYVTTSDNTMITKLKKLLSTEDSQWKVTKVFNYDSKPSTYELTCDKKCISFRSGKSTKRGNSNHTGEALKAWRERKNQ